MSTFIHNGVEISVEPKEFNGATVFGCVIIDRKRCGTHDEYNVVYNSDCEGALWIDEMLCEVAAKKKVDDYLDNLSVLCERHLI